MPHTQLIGLLDLQDRGLLELRKIAAQMPNDLPPVYCVSAHLPPSIHFYDSDQKHVNPIINHFGRDGWKADVKYGRTDYLKLLPSGVQIVIENAVRRPYVPEPVEFPEEAKN